MDLDDPAELRHELSRLYRALEESESKTKQIQKTNEKLKTDLEIYSASNGAANTGHAAKKIIELGKKTRSITTELESEKTKTRQLEKEKRILENKNSQLASKLAQANIEASGGDAYSMSSFAQNKKMEENLRQLQKENNGLKIDLQNVQLEMKNQKKILEMEIGSDFVNSSQLMGNGFKGRNQQIIALQSRVKELERIKAQTQENPSQIKQIKKDYHDFMEKYKKEIKEKDEKLEEMTKKNNMTKSRSQTLHNQVRILKEQMVALEEKGRHDDELVDALTARLKSKGKNVSKDSVLPTSMAQSATLLPSGVMKLESKESIQEIKELKNNLTQAEARVITQTTEIANLMSQLAIKSEQIIELESQIRNHKENQKTNAIERDSLEFEEKKDHQLGTQLETLRTEHEFLKGRLEHLNNDFETILNKVYQKKLPSDELTADDLKSLRTVLQNQIRARKEDSRKFDSILAENREAYLAAVELIQNQT